MSKSKEIRSSDGQILADLMDPDAPVHRIWRSKDLGAILRHELSAPVEFSLESTDPAFRKRLTRLCASHGLLLRSIGDLLHHQSPPVELLELTKEYAKACRQHPDSPLPPEIATVLYFASIAVAMMRCGRRITGLSDDRLRHGMEWGASIPWLDAKTRSLFEEARLFLVAREGAKA